MRYHVHWSEDVMSYEIKDFPQDRMDEGYPTEDEAREAAEISLTEWGPEDLADASDAS